MANKLTAPRVMNGKWGMVYIDGEPVYETVSYEAKLTIEREDVDFVGQMVSLTVAIRTRFVLTNFPQYCVKPLANTTSITCEFFLVLRKICSRQTPTDFNLRDFRRFLTQRTRIGCRQLRTIS